MVEFIKRQDAIDVVAKQYLYESDRMTALQELPVIIESEIEELKREKEYFKGEAESIWARFIKSREMHLKLAQKIAGTDSKSVANIILNMYFGKMSSDSCSFCEIFNLIGKGHCKEGMRCTDCIDNFLFEYYKNRIQAEGE